MELAWSGPRETELSILTSLDGKDWNAALETECRGRGRDEMSVYEFEPVEARFVRLRFGKHGDTATVTERGAVLQRLFFAYVYKVRIGNLPYPDAYAHFMPKDVFRKHSLMVDGAAGLNWVAASGVRGVRELVVHDIEENEDGYTVTLHFAEPDGLGPGERRFDIRIQDVEAKKDFDVVREAGGPDRAVTLKFENVRIDGSLRIELVPALDSEYPPLLSGVGLL